MADQGFPIIGVSNDRRRGTATFSVLDHLGYAIFHDRDAGVGGPQVDTDNFTHVLCLRICWPCVWSTARCHLCMSPRWGQRKSFSSLLVDRAGRATGTGLAHDHHGRTQQPTTQGITLLEDLDDRVGLDA